jgi:hypothetical protein
MSENTPPTSGLKALFQKNKSRIGMAILLLYVFLLGLGTVGELWDIEWILDLPIFRPPGKY